MFTTSYTISQPGYIRGGTPIYTSSVSAMPVYTSSAPTATTIGSRCTTTGPVYFNQSGVLPVSTYSALPANAIPVTYYSALPNPVAENIFPKSIIDINANNGARFSKPGWKIRPTQPDRKYKFIGYKYASVYETCDFKRCIVTLGVPEHALDNAGRKDIFNVETAKIRVSEADVLSIFDINSNKDINCAESERESDYLYIKGTTITCSFDENIDEVCSSGIHLYKTKKVVEDILPTYNIDEQNDRSLTVYHNNGARSMEKICKSGKCIAETRFDEKDRITFEAKHHYYD